MKLLMVLLLLLVLAAAPMGAWSQEEKENSRDGEQKAAEQIGGGVKQMHERQKDVEQGLSWRVALLPYLGHNNLYDQFHHDEPWNSEHNRKLIPMMPRVYQSHYGLPEGKTTYLALVSSVHQIPTTIGEEKMRRLVSRNDGQPVSLGAIR